MGAEQRDLDWLNRERQHLESLTPAGLRGEQARMWTALLDFSQRVTRHNTIDDILDAIVDTAAELTCSRRISLMLPDDAGRNLRIRRAIGIDDDIRRSVEVPVGHAVAGRAFETGQRVTGAETTITDTAAVRYHGGAYVSLPILTTSVLHGHQCVGVLNVTNRVIEATFDDWELEFLDLFSRMAGSAIDDLRWREAREAIIKIERDLKLAREIQTAALPQSLPALRGFDIAAWTQPAEHAGGDVYDVIGLPFPQPGSGIRTDADRAVFLVADVAGHGVGPALAAAQTRAMVRTAVRSGHDIAEITRVLDDQLVEDLPGGRFVCTWLAELNATDRTIRCLSAGLGDVLILHSGGKTSERITAACPPLGLGASSDIDTIETLTLQPGDIIAAVSDGITEATNPAGRQFGFKGLQRLIAINKDASASDIIAALKQELATFTGSDQHVDDCTAVVIRATA